MKKIQFKKNNGFAASDALIAVLIIAFFTGLISTLIYNIYISNSSIKRMSKAREYIVDVFEYIDKTYYDDVTQDNIIKYFNSKYYYDQAEIPKADAEVKMKEKADETITTPFKAEINIVNYNETEGNTDKMDLIKEITMTVKYKLGNKDQEVTIKRIKSRENLATPNRPDFTLLAIPEGKNYYPIKKSGDKWEVCNEQDSNWYNYQAGYWATILLTSENLQENQEIDMNNLPSDGEIYVWIPRFAYNSNDNSLIFLYSNGKNLVENDSNGYNTLRAIDENIYTILEDFTVNNIENTGVWTTDSSANESYEKLNGVYPVKK